MKRLSAVLPSCCWGLREAKGSVFLRKGLTGRARGAEEVEGMGEAEEGLLSESFLETGSSLVRERRRSNGREEEEERSCRRQLAE